MVVGAPVRVRLWDELVRDGESHTNNAIYFQKSNISFVSDMKQFCGNTYKIIKRFNNPLRVYLEICGADFGQWKYTAEMLDYVEPEKVVSSDYELSRRDRVDWASRIAKQFESERALVPAAIVKGDVDKLPIGLRFINFSDLLPVDSIRIVTLKGQVKDLTKKLAASKKLCERLQRRLRANWEARRDGEMCTHGELDLWLEKKRGCAKVTTLWNMPNKYDSVPKDWEIRPNGRTDWIPATRGNLKL
jgi:hypothetical protein